MKKMCENYDLAVLFWRDYQCIIGLTSQEEFKSVKIEREINMEFSGNNQINILASRVSTSYQ
jgi:hypothetical protein